MYHQKSATEPGEHILHQGEILNKFIVRVTKQTAIDMDIIYSNR